MLFICSYLKATLETTNSCWIRCWTRSQCPHWHIHSPHPQTKLTVPMNDVLVFTSSNFRELELHFLLCLWFQSLPHNASSVFLCCSPLDITEAHDSKITTCLLFSNYIIFQIIKLAEHRLLKVSSLTSLSCHLLQWYY